MARGDNGKQIKDFILKEIERINKEGLSKKNLEAIGDGVIKEMKDMISKGISPIEGRGRFPEYKSKTDARTAKNLAKVARNSGRRLKIQQANEKKITKQTRLKAKLQRKAAKRTGDKSYSRAAKDNSRRVKELAYRVRFTTATRRKVRELGNKARNLAKKAKRGYPYSVQGQFPNKRPRPVNLFLSGDFLKSLKRYVSGGSRIGERQILEIGFKDEDSVGEVSAVVKEDGHRTGANGQARRPIIPQGNERFAQRIERVIQKILGQSLEKYLKVRRR